MKKLQKDKLEKLKKESRKGEWSEEELSYLKELRPELSAKKIHHLDVFENKTFNQIKTGISKIES